MRHGRSVTPGRPAFFYSCLATPGPEDPGAAEVTSSARPSTPKNRSARFRRGMGRLLTMLFLAFSSLPGFAQADSGRFALVIGNGNYSELPRLANPGNDAEDIAAALRKLGFETRLLVDADILAMEDSVVKLGERLTSSPGSTGFFFYAGHGVQSNGTNYLIPVDAHVPSEAFLRTKALAVQTVLDTLQSSKNGLNVVVLDACRDNPFGWSRSGGTRGLSVVGSQPTGSIIIYSTSAGGTAQDGTGRNGVFTHELLKNLSTEGLEIKEVFNRTGAAVRDATGGKQVPAIYSQFFDTVYLASGTSKPINDPIKPGEAEVGASVASEADPVHVLPVSAASGQVADLMVRSSLPGASVSIDGLYRGKTPLLISALPSGKNIHVEVTVGMSSKAQDLLLEAGELRDITIPFDAKMGNLVVFSEESDMDVLLDGRSIGVLGSGVFRGIPVGAHKLELRGKDLYFGKTIRIPDEGTVQVRADPHPVGALAIDIPEGAPVSMFGPAGFINQHGSGFFENLPVGTYILRAGGGDWASVTTTLSIEKGKRSTWQPWKGGTLEFSVEPPKAICVLDGEQVLDCASPAIDIAPGEHQAVLKRPGFLDTAIVFTTSVGKKTRVVAALERMQPGVVTIANPGIGLQLRVDGELGAFKGRIMTDGSLRFDGIPSGYPISLRFLSNAILAQPETRVELAPGEELRLELPAGSFTLPWVARDAELRIGGKRFDTEGGQAWSSPALPIGTYRVEVGGTFPFSSSVSIELGSSAELPGYSDALKASMERRRQSDLKALANRDTRIAAGWGSLAAGVAGFAGAGLFFWLENQAIANDRASATSGISQDGRKDWELYQGLSYTTAVFGGLSMGLSRFLLTSGPDADALHRSIAALDEGIQALSK